jgi:hypothetical protein
VAVAALPRWDEGDRADTRAPSVSGWKREEDEGKEVGPREIDGPEEGVGPAGKRKEGEKSWAARWAGKRRKAGWLKEREGGRKGFETFHFFQNLFNFSNFLNLNSFQILNTSSLFQNFQNILKTFKTSHKQTIKPCIQLMMHKHLLLLNY